MALNLSALAGNLIKNLSGAGQKTDYVLRVETGGTVDFATGQATPGVFTDTPIDATEVRFSAGFADGEHVKTRDIYLYVSATVDVPEGASFLIRNEPYSIITRQPVYNGAVIQLQRFHLRGS